MSDIEEVNDHIVAAIGGLAHIVYQKSNQKESTMNTTEPTDFNALRELVDTGRLNGHLDETAGVRAHAEIDKAAAYVVSLQRALGEAEASAAELKQADETDKVEPEQADGPRIDWQKRDARVLSVQLAKGDVDRARKIVAFIEEG